MRKECEYCGRAYNAKHPSSKTCSAACRKGKSRIPAVEGAESAGIEQDSNELESGLVAATRRALVESGQVDTVAGQQALRLAEAMSQRETGSGLSQLSKALTAVMEELAGGKSVASDVLDEVKARREARRAG